MLVMRRRQGETILIGEEIEIHIAHIGRSRVKIGIQAPKQLRVVAKEIKLVGEENRAAAEADVDSTAAARIARALASASQVPELRPICLAEVDLAHPEKRKPESDADPERTSA